MKVLVCGGRTFGVPVSVDAQDEPRAKRQAADERAMMKRVLDGVHTQYGISLIIQGEAKGADAYAKEWALVMGVHVLCFPAQWARDGRGAGPKRNQEMLERGKPDLVVAFPGRAGTRDMVKKAEAAGVPVLKHPTLS